jgi:hypothetical protein
MRRAGARLQDLKCINLAAVGATPGSVLIVRCLTRRGVPKIAAGDPSPTREGGVLGGATDRPYRIANRSWRIPANWLTPL